MNTINLHLVKTLNALNLTTQILNKILFLDIETVSEKHHFQELNETFQKLWTKKAISIQKNLQISDIDEIAALYEAKAGIFAEYSKIVCISVAYLNAENKLRVKSFAGDDEKQLLKDFTQLLSQHFNDPERFFLCGHNIKEFDIPFICRRLIKHRMALPALLNVAGKKPWQTEFLIDTMDLWRFGDIKNYTSLELIAATLDIPTPKDDIDGSQVGRVYWEDHGLDRIVTYCQKDVVTVVRLIQHFMGIDGVSDEDIDWV